MPTFALFGASYIKRLENYCRGDLNVPGKVKFYGKGGLRSDRIMTDIKAKRLWRDCLRAEADVYFIHIGGNDITKTSEPEDIFRRIVGMVDKLHRRTRCQVYVAEIQTRGDFRDGLTKPEFDKQRHEINELLKEKYDQYLVRFDEIVYPDDYDDDLVHLDASGGRRRSSGMGKFHHRIRRIFCGNRRHSL